METSLRPCPFYSDEGELNQECRDLLATLPKETGWLSSDLYKYQGFWYVSQHLQGVVSFQKHFRAQDTDLLLVTIPKSGTTWFKAILFALVNRTRYNPSSLEANHPLILNNPHVLVPFLELDLYYYNDHNPDLSSFASPRFFSTHIPILSLPKSVRNLSCKVVYLCRNPKDTFVSLWYFSQKIRPRTYPCNTTFEEAFDKFCNGLSVYGPFWDHALGYWAESLRNSEKVLFLKYEDMKEKPSFYLNRMADFLGCPFSLEEEKNGIVEDILQLCSFDKLSNLEVNKHGEWPSGLNYSAFFRRGEVGDWKNHLTLEMVQRLDQISKEKLYGSGLNF